MKNHKHYLQPDWPAPSTVKAFTTTRSRGNSLAPYNNFNLGTHVGDDPTAVDRNRQQLLSDLGLPSAPIWIKQVHGINAISLNTPHDGEPTADASYTHQTNQVCAVLTADCLPILLCNHQGTAVAAIHAGWRGLLAGIIDSTLSAMQLPGRELYAWLGPAIGPQAFEVNGEIVDSYIQRDPHNQAAFHKEGSRWMGNLYQLATNNFAQCGVTQVYGGKLCTYNDEARFYSYRRDNITGRMATIIWIANA